jgi:hypothetical protein
MDSSDTDSVPSQEWIRSEIEGYLDDWRPRRGRDYWRGPRVGIASADDPLFSQLGRAVDPRHAMPRDLLTGARSVVVFFLPFSPALGKANGEKKGLASRGWAEAYVETNLLIRKIGSHLVGDRGQPPNSTNARGVVFSGCPRFAHAKPLPCTTLIGGCPRFPRLAVILA